MARARVGVMGCGNVSAYSYMPHLMACPYIDLVAVCDGDEGQARRVAEAYSIPTWYGNAEAMLAGSDVELAINLPLMLLHVPLNLQALPAGRHVLCEKPIATNLRDADRLLEEAARSGRRVEIHSTFPWPLIDPANAWAAPVARR